MLRYTVLIVSLMTFLRDYHVSSCDYNCADKPEFTPSTLVVKLRDPASASCSVCQHACLSNGTLKNIETPVGKVSTNGTTVSWTVDSLTEWHTSPTCFFYNDTTSGQCCTILPVVVYQPPDQVSFSFVNHSGPMSEGNEYDLQCAVEHVAPAESLVVTFYKGQTVLDQQRPKNTQEKKPVSEIFTLSINVTKEDDGVQLWCEAKLDLGPDGPQPPPVVKSQSIDAIVYYEPQFKEPSHPNTITIKEGNPLHLNCSAVGNPSPSYEWKDPSNNSLPSNTEVLTINSVTPVHEGKYTCHVTNYKGTARVEFNVVVQADHMAVIIGVIAAVGFLALILVIFVYSYFYKHNRMGQYNLKDVFRMHTRHSVVPTVE